MDSHVLWGWGGGGGVNTCHLSYFCSFASDKYNIPLVVCLILNSLGISTSILYTAGERGAQAGLLLHAASLLLRMGGGSAGRATTLPLPGTVQASPSPPPPTQALPRKGATPFHKQTPLLIPEFSCSDFPGNSGAASPHHKVMGISHKVQDQVTDPDFHQSILLLTKHPLLGQRFYETPVEDVMAERASELPPGSP